MLNFNLLLSGLRAAIAVVSARERDLTPLLVAVWGRISRMAVRLERLVALWRAGKLPKPRAPRVSANQGADRADRAKIKYPTYPGWLVDRVREALAARSQLEHLLSTEECVAFLAEVPQAGRILRPLCRMLGIGAKQPKRRVAPRDWVTQASPARAGLVVGPVGKFLWV
jgi:hypothetical protein